MERDIIIQKISESLHSISGIETILFGSTARGDFREDSDIDILILLPDYLNTKERIELELEISGILWEIEMESGIEISPIILQKKIWNQRKTPFTINVTNQGIEL